MMQDPLMEDKETTTADLPDEPRAGAAVAVYMQRIAMRLALRLWWLLLPAMVCIVWGLASDWRIAVIGLMLLFLVFPMVMTLAIMNHAVRPEVVALTRAADFLMNDSSLTLFNDDGGVIKTISRVSVRNVSLHGSSLEVCFGKGVADIMLVSRTYLGEERARQILNEFIPEESLN